MSSQQISWWEVHLYVEPLLDEVGTWPLPGTAEWRELRADDPRKVAGILDAARRWALAVETRQEAQCQASHAISAALDWSALSCAIARRRRSPYIARERSTT